jgi:hypothetical protein
MTKHYTQENLDVFKKVNIDILEGLAKTAIDEGICFDCLLGDLLVQMALNKIIREVIEAGGESVTTDDVAMFLEELFCRVTAAASGSITMKEVIGGVPDKVRQH